MGCEEEEEKSVEEEEEESEDEEEEELREKREERPLDLVGRDESNDGPVTSTTGARWSEGERGQRRESKGYNYHYKHTITHSFRFFFFLPVHHPSSG